MRHPAGRQRDIGIRPIGDFSNTADYLDKGDEGSGSATADTEESARGEQSEAQPEAAGTIS